MLGPELATLFGEVEPSGGSGSWAVPLKVMSGPASLLPSLLPAHQDTNYSGIPSATTD